MELYSLKVGDVDLKTGKVDIRHGVMGGAKGGAICSPGVDAAQPTLDILYILLSQFAGEHFGGQAGKPLICTSRGWRALSKHRCWRLVIQNPVRRLRSIV